MMEILDVNPAVMDGGWIVSASSRTVNALVYLSREEGGGTEPNEPEESRLSICYFPPS